MEKIKGYKGFDKDMKCRGFQYETDKDYEQEDDIRCCSKGFHFCENPFDVFHYYPPCNSRFCEVEGSGVVDKDSDNIKVASSHIHIGAEIGLNGLIKAGVKFIFDKVNWENARESNTGYYSAATNTGDYSAATNTGYRSAATNTGCRSAATNTGDHSAATNTGYRSVATNTGDQSAATVKGQDSIAIVTGKESKASGTIGCWLVLTERDEEWQIVDVKAVKVDGKTIKENTFYSLINGKIQEVV